MSISLNTLVSDIQTDVPAIGGVPSEDQVEQAVKDAVFDFGSRAGRKKITTLAIVANTATYDLPADFVSVIDLPKLSSPDGILVTPSGLVPVSVDFCEEYTVAGGKITFYPTPTYSVSRYLKYKAGWALVDGAYDLTEMEASIVKLLARSLTKGKQASAAGGGVSYRQGDVAVDTTGAGQNLQADVDALKGQYLEAVERYIGTILILG